MDIQLLSFPADSPPLSVIVAAKLAGITSTADSSLASGSAPTFLFTNGYNQISLFPQLSLPYLASKKEKRLRFYLQKQLILIYNTFYFYCFPLSNFVSLSDFRLFLEFMP